MAKFASSVVLLAWFISATISQGGACDLCSVYTATEAQGLAKSGFRAGIAEQFTHFGTLQMEGGKVQNTANQYENSLITQLLLGYNFNNRVGFQLSIPLIYRSFRRPQGFKTDQGTESGIGDASLTGNLLAYRVDDPDFTLIWNTLGGIKFPTGSSSRLKEELSEADVEGAPESAIHGHDLTLGTGSLDALLGTSIYTRWNKLFFSGSAQYAVRNRGAFGYLFANDLTWNAGLGEYLALEHERTFAVQANLSGESKGVDHLGDTPQGDTGITSLYLGPRFLATWKSDLSAEFGMDFPVSIKNTGLQIVPDFRIRGNFTWQF